MREPIHLYNGEVLLEFDSGKHTYVLVKDGKRHKIPSVTTICGIIDKSGPLIGWAINNTLSVCREGIMPYCEHSETYLAEVFEKARKASRGVKGEAARKGTEIHRAIEDGLAGSAGGAGLNPIAEEGIAWLRSSGLRARATEQRIYSRRFRYSGTLDLLAQDSDDNLVLVDWKTGKAVYPEFRLQTAAYVKAWEEEHPDQPIERRIIVRLSEGGAEPHVYPRSLLRKDFKAFLGAKDLYEELQKIAREDREVCNKST